MSLQIELSTLLQPRTWRLIVLVSLSSYISVLTRSSLEIDLLQLPWGESDVIMKLAINGKINTSILRDKLFIQMFELQYVPFCILDKNVFVAHFGKNRVLIKKQKLISLKGSLITSNLYNIYVLSSPIAVYQALETSL